MSEHVAYTSRCPTCNRALDRTVTQILKKQVIVIITCQCECGYKQSAQVSLATLINHWLSNYRRPIKTEELEVI